MQVPPYCHQTEHNYFMSPERDRGKWGLAGGDWGCADSEFAAQSVKQLRLTFKWQRKVQCLSLAGYQFIKSVFNDEVTRDPLALNLTMIEFDPVQTV